jgi:hypothetical protein
MPTSPLSPSVTLQQEDNITVKGESMVNKILARNIEDTHEYTMATAQQANIFKPLKESYVNFKNDYNRLLEIRRDLLKAPHDLLQLKKMHEKYDKKHIPNPMTQLLINANKEIAKKIIEAKTLFYRIMQVRVEQLAKTLPFITQCQYRKEYNSIDEGKIFFSHQIRTAVANAIGQEGYDSFDQEKFPFDILQNQDDNRMSSLIANGENEVDDILIKDIKATHEYIDDTPASENLRRCLSEFMNDFSRLLTLRDELSELNQAQDKPEHMSPSPMKVSKKIVEAIELFDKIMKSRIDWLANLLPIETQARYQQGCSDKSKWKELFSDKLKMAVANAIGQEHYVYFDQKHLPVAFQVEHISRVRSGNSSIIPNYMQSDEKMTGTVACNINLDKEQRKRSRSWGVSLFSQPPKEQKRKSFFGKLRSLSLSKS